MKILVITSIAQKISPLMQNIFTIASQNNCQTILVGDRKTGNLECAGVKSISSEEQLSLSWNIVEQLPWNSYSRKNIGYLEALKSGAKWVIETDDDNLPSREFFDLDFAPNLEVRMASNMSWLNVYKYFGNQVVWPRGFPLRRILEQKSVALPVVTITLDSVGVFQALADNDPDVDAIFRLTQVLPQNFSSGLPVLLSNGTVCPFNAQATWWNAKYGVLMYFPSTISWRVADIWRSYITTFILQANSVGIVFTGPLVTQIRNSHDLLIDFKEEIDSYLQADNIWQCLSEIDPKAVNGEISVALFKVYEHLVVKEFIPQEEIRILKSWISDIKKINILKDSENAITNLDD
jgi:hypothetical protein